jgi:NitT/TauT family transport system substrate-binding protein
MTIVRLVFLAMVVAMLGQAAGEPLAAQTLTKIRVIAVPIDISAAAYYAQDKGFFKQVGLDAEVSSMGNGAQVIAALVGGQIEFGSGGTTSVALAHERGLPIVMVAPAGSYSVKVRSHGMVVAPNSPIKGPKDLAGKTVALAGLKTLGDVAVHAWLTKNGVEATSIKFIEMPYTAMFPAVLSGRVDAADLEEPYLSPALAQGGRSIGNVFDAIAPQWVEGAYFTTESYAKAHPDVVKKFADAIALAGAWANKNPVEAWKVLDKYTNTSTPPERQHVVYTERLRASEIQPVIDASAQYGVLQSAFPAKDMFAPGIGE